MDDRTKSIIDKVMEATDRVQQEVAARPVVSATRERALAVRQRAQTAALSTLHLATREDVARMQASLDRVEAALNDISKRLPDAAAAKPRAARTKPAAREAKSA